MRLGIWGCVVALITLVLVLEATSRSSPSAEERNALENFLAVQNTLEAAGPSPRFYEQLHQAENRLQSLKRAGGNTCFSGALERNVASYRMIDRVVQSERETVDVNRKLDLELALATSMAFARTNLQQAANCYR